MGKTVSIPLPTIKVSALSNTLVTQRALLNCTFCPPNNSRVRDTILVSHPLFLHPSFFPSNKPHINPRLRFEPLMSLRYPPMSILAKRILPFLMFNGIHFSRPKSVEHEQGALKRRKWGSRLVWFGVVLAGALVGGRLIMGKGF